MYTNNVRIAIRHYTIDKYSYKRYIPQYSRDGKNWLDYKDGERTSKDLAWSVIFAHSAKTNHKWSIHPTVYL